MAPTSIDGTEITGATIDGQDVSEITVDGETVFTAIPDSVIEDFEQNNLNSWNNTGGITIRSSTALEGSFNLEVTSPLNNVGGRPYSLEGDGLPFYPGKGAKFSFLARDGGTTTRPGIVFGVDENTNGIDGFEIRHVNKNEANVNRLDDGQAAGFDIRPSFTTGNAVYEYVTQWHDGSGSQPDNTFELDVFEVDGSLNRIRHALQSFTWSDPDNKYQNNTGLGFTNGSSGIDSNNRLDFIRVRGTVD